MASAENKQRRSSYSCSALAWHSQNSNRRLVVRLIINIIVPIFAWLRAALACLPLRPPPARPLLLLFLHLLLPWCHSCLLCVPHHTPCMSTYHPPSAHSAHCPINDLFHPDPDLVQLLPSSSQVLFSMAFPCRVSPLILFLYPPWSRADDPSCAAPLLIHFLHPSNIPIIRARLFVFSRAWSLVKTANKVRTGLARSWRHAQPRWNSAVFSDSEQGSTCMLPGRLS